MELNIWRAPTDNDMYIKAEWKKAHYDEAYTHAYKVEALQNKYGIIVMSHVSVEILCNEDGFVINESLFKNGKNI